MAKYNEEDITKILNILDNIEIKGINAMNEILIAVQILQSPSEIIIEEDEKGSD